MERLFLKKWLEKLPRVISHVYVTVVVLFSFLVFSAASPMDAVTQFGGMLGLNGVPLWNGESLYGLRSCGVILAAALIGAMPTVPYVISKLRMNQKCEAVLSVLQPVVTAALLLASTAFLVAGSFNPFLYWQF